MNVFLIQSYEGDFDSITPVGIASNLEMANKLIYDYAKRKGCKVKEITGRSFEFEKKKDELEVISGCITSYTLDKLPND